MESFHFYKFIATLYKMECYPLYSPIRDVAITEQQKSIKKENEM